MWEESVYIIPNGQQRSYVASDNLVSEKYKGLTPPDLIDIAMCNRIQYDGAKQTGVMFHMIGALSQYGKLGIICIGRTIAEAKKFYLKTIDVLDKECSSLINSAFCIFFYGSKLSFVLKTDNKS